MTPIGKQDLDAILLRSRDLQEAVQQIEAISVGAQLAPVFSLEGGKGLDPEMVQKLINQRVDNELERIRQESDKAIVEQRQQIAELQRQLKEAKEAKAKVGRKKAAKKTGKRRNSVLDKMPKDDDDEPELTEEQQALLDETMAGHSRTE